MNGAPPLPKEDPLSSYTPIVEEKIVVFTQEDPIVEVAKDTNRAMDPLNSFVPEQAIEKTPDTVMVPTESIPDWLKAPIIESQKETITEATETPINDTNNTKIESKTTDEKVVTQEEKTTEATIEDSIPDWLKSVQTTDTLAESKSQATVEIPTEKAPTNTDSEKLPDWLINSLQSEETKSEEILPLANTTLDPIIQEDTPMNLFELSDSSE